MATADERRAVRERAIQGYLDAAAGYEELAARTADVDVRRFLLERARICREAARTEMERAR